MVRIPLHPSLPVLKRIVFAAFRPIVLYPWSATNTVIIFHLWFRLHLPSKLLLSRGSESANGIYFNFTQPWFYNSNSSSRASLALTWLTRMHTLKKRGVVPCSLFLDHLLQCVHKRAPSDGSLRPFKVTRDSLLTSLNKVRERIWLQIITVRGRSDIYHDLSFFCIVLQSMCQSMWSPTQMHFYSLCSLSFQRSMQTHSPIYISSW